MMSLLMHYLDVILCSLNLIIKFLVFSQYKNYMLLILTLKMLMKIVEKGEHGINMCRMTVFCTVLTSFVFPLVPFTFYFCRKCMEVL
jgi:hypothetical protein